MDNRIEIIKSAAEFPEYRKATVNSPYTVRKGCCFGKITIELDSHKLKLNKNSLINLLNKELPKSQQLKKSFLGLGGSSNAKVRRVFLEKFANIKPKVEPKVEIPVIVTQPIKPQEPKIETPIEIEPAQEDLPEVSKKPGFFVDVLNKKGYKINGKDVTLPDAGFPENFVTKEAVLLAISDEAIPEFKFKDLSTEWAIQRSKAFPIALNFANEHHMGGGPGFHKDPETDLFVYDAPSARAQEESMCQRSDLMASLTLLPHTLKGGRSYYNDPFDSRKMAYVSDNHLFAVQGNKGFYDSTYLKEPKTVAFVTSAAKNYGDKNNLDCSKNSEVYEDARKRIETHLLAAAHRAAISKKENPDQPVELILGAFGCGAFAPQGNPNEYRAMIASIYAEMLPECNGFFDVITFAVPTFGDDNPLNPAVANHRIFKSVLVG